MKLGSEVINAAINRHFGWKFGERDECASEYPDAWIGPCWWFNGIPFAPEDLPDYFTREDANSRLLDLMLHEPGLSFYLQTFNDPVADARIAIKWQRKDSTLWQRFYHDDRKTCVVMAFCKFAGIEP